MPDKGVAAKAFTLPGSKRAPGVHGDDAASATVVSPAAIALVVADGLGSARHGDSGARKAVELGMVALHAPIRDFAGFQATIGEMIVRWSRWASSEGKGERASGSDYATTFAACLVTPSGLYIAAVGDCFAIAARGADRDSLFLILEQEKPDPENITATATLEDEPALVRVRFRHVRDPDLTGVLLSTDGLEDSILDYESVVSEVSNEPHTFVRGINPGAAFALFKYVTSWSSEQLASAIAAEPSVMDVKGDDIGVAIAAW